MLSNKKILLTGSNGFIGKHLKSFLKEINCFVKCIDLTNGYNIISWNSINSLNGFDFVIHLAAKTYIPDSFTNPREYFEANVQGTINMLELCRLNKATMIFNSTYVYGNPKYLPIDEKHTISCGNPYTKSKVMAEEACSIYSQIYEIPIVILRPFNVFGIGQNKNFLIPSIFEQANNGIINLKSPKPKRDMIYVDDLVRVYAKIITKNWNGFNIFNIGSGVSFSVHEMANKIAKLFKCHKILFEEITRKNEIMNTVADIKKIKDHLNWYPKVSFEDGINKIYKDFINIK